MVTVSVCGMISTENVSSVDLVDRQRDAVERDRALERDEARSARRGARNVSRAMSVRSSRATSSAMPSTWPATIWPPSSSPILSARSRLSRVPCCQRADRGQPQRLGGGVDGEPGAGRRAPRPDHGQADAGAGDRGADVRSSPRHRRRRSSAGAALRPARLDRQHFADIGDDAR